LEAIEAAAADQSIVGATNCPLNALALLFCDLDDQAQPFIGISVGVAERNSERAVVDVPVVEIFDERVLVRREKLG